MIQNELFTQSLDATGDVPTAAQLNAVHDDALTLLQQSQTLGTAYDAALTKRLAYAYGSDRVIVRNAGSETPSWSTPTSERSKVTSPDELSASIAKLKLPVDVSTKYGAWNEATLSFAGLRRSPDGLPSFVTLSPAPVASAATG